MTVHELLAETEQRLREDNEYWDQIDNLIHRHNKIMASAIIRLAVAIVTERSNSSCTDCNGVYLEEECQDDD